MTSLLSLTHRVAHSASLAALALLAPCIVATLTGCGSDPTELVVFIDTDLRAPSDVTELVVEVTGATTHETRRAPLVGSGAVSLPVTLGLYRESGGDEVTVVVTALQGAVVVQRRTARARFVAGQSRLLEVVLPACCAGRDCGAESSCGPDGCAPPDVPAERLPTFDGTLPHRFAGVCASEVCDGVDNDGDGTIDEGYELRSEVGNCGACGNDCRSKDSVSAATCNAGSCAVTSCVTGRADCDAGGLNGCEVLLATDPLHCGGCDRPCATTNGTATCVESVCALRCSPGFGDCELPAPGCETALDDSTANCGRCGRACAGTCADGYCDAERVTAIAAGGSHACALRASGSVVCWGANTDGQLGDGSTNPGRAPVAVVGLTDARSLAVGAQHSCAVRAGGEVVCWGDGASGQLGDGFALDRSSPVTVLGVTGATRVVAGNGHSCALRDDGTVLCWGRNDAGQLGRGTLSPSALAPAAVVGLTNASALVASAMGACAVRADGTVSCWGSNERGELGNGGGPLSASTPQPVTGLTTVAALATSASSQHVCALRTDGGISCWGDNRARQIVDSGTVLRAATPLRITLTGTVTGIATGASHSCVALLAGGVRCWGANAEGQLGDGTTVDRGAAAPVDALTDSAALAAGDQHTCSLDSRGAVSCWGRNVSGQLGLGTMDTQALRPSGVSGLPY